VTVSVDASQAPQRIYHAKVVMPAVAGPFTFVYPEWFPGWHGPVGPLPNVVNLHVLAGGSPIAWRRDLVDFYAIHVDVPPAASSVEVDFDVVGAPSSIGDQSTQQTQNIVAIQWSDFLVYPQGARSDDLQVEARIALPATWEFGTALPIDERDGSHIAFKTVSLTTLVDSPLDAGRFFRRIELGDDPPSEIDLFAESSAALAMRPELIAGYKRLMREAPALYGNRHYRSYRFLLALSDELQSDGIEHHESSDNRVDEDYVTDPDAFRAEADLLAHEYSHSWNGKYRRPAGLTTPDFQAPMHTDLLWVYEGMNQYLGELLTARSGLVTLEEQRESLAMSAASMDAEGGRNWRPLRDVADEAPILYVAPAAWGAARRNATSIYTEGTLVWLEIDTILRGESHGRKSLDDFLHLYAAGGSTTPSVKTYDLNEIIALLEATVPYDWRGFIHQRIDLVSKRAPVNGIERAGWHLTYTDEPTPIWKAYEESNKVTDLRYSLGLTVSGSGDPAGSIVDVEPGSPAAQGGIVPGMRLIAVNGRQWSPEALHAALDDAKQTHRPLQLLVFSDEFYQTIAVAADSGNRYPRLERIAGTPDLLSQIYAPRTSGAAK
jgi:predicted metalloprotease with PDZ domain